MNIEVNPKFEVGTIWWDVPNEEVCKLHGYKVHHNTFTGTTEIEYLIGNFEGTPSSIDGVEGTTMDLWIKDGTLISIKDKGKYILSTLEYRNIITLDGIEYLFLGRKGELVYCAIGVESEVFYENDFIKLINEAEYMSIVEW